MNFVWFSLVILSILLWTTNAKYGQFIDIPFSNCSGAEAVSNPSVTMTKITKNATFVDNGTYFGPASCDYLIYYSFTTEDAEKLKLGVKLNGIPGPDFDVCNKAKPACISGKNQTYTSYVLFPGIGTAIINGKVTVIVTFKKNGKTLSCTSVSGYYYKTSCCG